MTRHDTIKDEALNTEQAPDKDDRLIVGLPWYESLHTRIEGGHDVRLLESGREYFPALLADIGAARERVFLETYIFQDDPCGVDMANALAGAAQRGIRVHLVIDGYGTSGFSGEVLRILSHSLVRIEVFRPKRRLFDFNRQRLRRLHRKLAVIDGRVAYVGGLNVIDDFDDPRLGRLEYPRLDYAVRVQGPLVAHVHVAVTRMWWELSVLNRSLGRRAQGGHRLRKGQGSLKDSLKLPEVVHSDITRAGDVRAMLMLRDNFLHRRSIEAWYLRAIGRSKRDILIANAYFLPGIRFRRALLEARKRGVRVRLFLRGMTEYRLMDWAARAMYDEFLLAGVEIIEYRKSHLHAKVAVIDDQCTVGSSNIDPFSLLLAREANIVVLGASFAAQLRLSLERAIDDGGVAVEARHHLARPWPVRWAHKFGYAMLRVAIAVGGLRGKY